MFVKEKRVYMDCCDKHQRRLVKKINVSMGPCVYFLDTKRRFLYLEASHTEANQCFMPPSVFNNGFKSNPQINKS